MDKLICFGLTEPLNGSDASGLRTTAKKVEGGYLLNGSKKWIGNGMVADYLTIWAKNLDDGGRIQGFIVRKGAKGLSTSKIYTKMALRIVQNANIELQDVFVPDDFKLAKVKNFETGARPILIKSRAVATFCVAGLAAGAYEEALRYTLERK